MKEQTSLELPNIDSIKKSDDQRPGTTLTHTPQMELRDVFMIHATLADVLIAEDTICHDQTLAGIEVDALTTRIQARYIVADRMLRVRGESPLGQGIATLLPDHEANQKKETR